jgi:hypothetical protein
LDQVATHIDQEDTMSPQQLEHELLELERRYWQAMMDKDAEAALSLTDDPCIISGAQGVATLNHEHMRGMLKSAQWKLNEFTLSDDAQIRLLSDDVAVLAYKVRENLTVDGEPVTLEAADASTWIRRDGRWRCALHTESIVGDPFGRDRQSARVSEPRASS